MAVPEDPAAHPAADTASAIAMPNESSRNSRQLGVIGSLPSYSDHGVAEPERHDP
jgi:hypothetical protein